MHSKTIRPAILFILLTIGLLPAVASTESRIVGRVFDPQGAVVANATVTLLNRDGKSVTTRKTAPDGSFQFTNLDSNWYQIRAEAKGFTQTTQDRVFLPRGSTAAVDVILQVGPLRQDIVVSATGTGLPTAQVGASVSVVRLEDIVALSKPDVLEVLRLVPGMEVVQTGQRGGTTSIFVRGGNPDFNKVLIDGIPANDIGGGFEFADLATAGVDQVEVLRGPNSVIYGADALAGVINITTVRGSSLFPELAISIDGGNFGTHHQAGSLGGAFRQFDYFSEFSRVDTQNAVQNDTFHDATFSGNYGWSVSPRTTLRATVRNATTAVGLPNAIDFFGIPDDSSQKYRATFLGTTADMHATAKWANVVRYGYTRLLLDYVNPAPTGEPFDPFGFGPNYVGNTVRVHGANGYSVVGSAILDFGGTYPQVFHADAVRHSLYAQSAYEVRPELSVVGGFRYENESGFTDSGGTKSPTGRNNVGGFAQLSGSLGRRLYATAGIGLDENAVFGFAASPRVSVAYYVHQPPVGRVFEQTKLTANFGKGIKEPSIFDQGSSLYTLLSKSPQTAPLISTFGIAQIGPERSRSFDFGVEQGLCSGRARVGITGFHNSFYNLIEYVDKGAFAQLGIPQSIAATAPFSATVNSAAYWAKGVEAEAEGSVGHGLHLRASYTYLDAVVTRSFSSSALTPVPNPAFPNIPIGAYSPLVGSRPFRRAPHSGNVLIDYSHRKFGMTVAGYFVGRSDDSTFLSDPYFGNSMLLPNRNLLPGYRKIDVSGRFVVNRFVSLHTSIENALSEHYVAASGYPALLLTFRAGMRLKIGGDEWKRK